MKQNITTEEKIATIGGFFVLIIGISVITAIVNFFIAILGHGNWSAFFTSITVIAITALLTLALVHISKKR